MTQPFQGAYVEQNVGYSPPLQVEPPPRDPNYTPPERPFEPTPFMDPQPHAVRTDRSAYTRDKWNRMDSASGGPPPPPRDYSGYYQQQQKQQQQRTTKRHKTNKAKTSSPFDNLRDMFSNIGSKNDEAESSEKDEPIGFKSGNVEVLTAEEGRRRRQQELEFIDAEVAEDDKDSGSSWQDDRNDEEDLPPQSFHEAFSAAWKGGPESAPPSSSPFTVNGGSNSSGATPNNNSNAEGITDSNNNNGANTMLNDPIIQKAQHLLATNSKIRSILSQAQANAEVRDLLGEAIRECSDNPIEFGRYLEDEDVGPILNELRECL